MISDIVFWAGVALTVVSAVVFVIVDRRLVPFGDATDYEPRQYELAYWWDRLDDPSDSAFWKQGE